MAAVARGRPGVPNPGSSGSAGSPTVLRPVPGVTPEMVAQYRPLTPGFAARIARRILEEVAAFSDDPRVQEALSRATRSAVELFVDALAGAPAEGRSVGAFYRRLGRREAEAGRGLDALRAAHHVATQEATVELRRFAAELDLDAASAARVTEVLHAYLERLFNEAFHGYLEAREERLHDRGVARRQLMDTLLSGRWSSSVEELAARAGWPTPDSIVVAVARVPEGKPIGREADRAALTCVRKGYLTIVGESQMMEAVIADRAARFESPVAVGWPVTVEEVHLARRWAMRALRLAAEGLIQVPEDHLLRCADHRAALCIHADPELRRRADLDALRPLLVEKGRRRVDLAETLLVALQTRQGAPGIAAHLKVHHRTVRARTRRLEELFGDRLQDRTRAVDLLTALESALPRWRQEIG